MDDDLKALLVRELKTIQDTLDRLRLEHARTRGLAANLGEAHLRLWQLVDRMPGPDRTRRPDATGRPDWTGRRDRVGLPQFRTGPGRTWRGARGRPHTTESLPDAETTAEEPRGERRGARHRRRLARSPERSHVRTDPDRRPRRPHAVAHR